MATKLEKAKAELVKAAHEREAELLNELAEVEATLKALGAGTTRKKVAKKAPAKKKAPRRNGKRYAKRPGVKVALVHHGRMTMAGRVVKVVSKYGPMSSAAILTKLQEQGVSTTSSSVQTAVSLSGKAGLIMHLPGSSLWAISEQGKKEL